MRFLIDPKSVREVRIRLGLTQEQFAAAMCLSRGAVAKWECRPEQPRDGAPAIIMRALAAALPVPPLGVDWSKTGDTIKAVLVDGQPIEALAELVSFTCYAQTRTAAEAAS